MDAAVWLYDLGRQELVRRICDSTMVDRRPRLSPDGREILLTSERSGRLQIWACNLETDESRLIGQGPNGVAVDGEWSPEGERIAYTVNWPGRGELRVAKRSGEDLGVLASGAGEWRNPQWSAAGDELHYLVEKDGKSELRVVGLSGGGERQIGKLGKGAGLLLRKDGRYWVLTGGKVGLYGPGLELEREVLVGVDQFSGLNTDRLGLVYTRQVSTAMAGSYELYEHREDKGERRLAPAVKSGMGFAAGPAGYALLVQSSEPKADVFRAGPLR